MTATNTLMVETEHWALTDLAKNINAAVASAEGYAKSAMETALHAGKLLNQAKTHVTHGAWEAWLATNCSVSPRTARAYMRLATAVPNLPEPERQRVADLPVREAMRAISTNPDQAPRAKGMAVRAEGKDDAQRVADAIRAVATVARDSAKRFELIRELNAVQVAALRKKLAGTIEAATAAIQLLDKHQVENRGAV